MTTSYMRTSREGFTLIEILIAIAIVGILGALVAPNFLRYLDSSRVKATKLSLVGVQKAIDDYNMDTNRYPEKLRDLVKKPSGEIKGWDGPYLKKDEVPEDVWGEPFQYKPTPGGKKQYDLYSFGPKRRGSPKEEHISVWDV